MPRVLRNYQRVDFSYLLNANTEEDTAVQEEPEKKYNNVCPFPAPYVSPDKRRRDSLMDNKRMRYAYSAGDLVLHDRDCPQVAKILDYQFHMLSDYSHELKPCPTCRRKALIRAGINTDDAKKITAYENVFKLFGTSTEDLYTLIIENKAELSNVNLNSVNIKVHEDKWILLKDNKSLNLYHNNYDITTDYERILRNSFHQQFHGSIKSVHYAIKTMCTYSWADHVIRLMTLAYENSRKQLRERLADIRNWVKVEHFSLLNSYFVILDCNSKASRYFRKNKTKANILSRSPSETPYHVLTCRVRKWNRKKFYTALDQLKEYSVIFDYDEYADQCIAQLGNPEN